MLRPATLDAQRFTCEEARTILLSDDASRVDLFSAGNTIINECGTIAAGTIATALRRAALHTTLDTLASELARLTFDRRLADSISTVALDSTQSTERRTFYLQLLANYAAPGTGIDFDAEKNGALSVLHRNIHVVMAPRWRPFGTRPIRAEDRARVLATIGRMSTHDADESLRRLAQRVVTELSRYIEADDRRDELFRRPP